MTKPFARLHGIVRGRVQGVGFRWFVLSRGRSLGLTGEVRNLSNGSVEVSAEGFKADLEMLAVAIKEGPDSSHVEDFSIEWENYSGQFSAFEISPTR